MIIKRSLAIYIFLILGAFFYAIYLAGLPIDGFVDRNNYLRYISESDYILKYNLENSYFFIFSNEPFWLLINAIVGYFLSPEDGVRLIIFFSAFVFYFFSGKEIFSIRSDLVRLWIIFIFIILSPQILKNFIVHLRQGLAISVFFLVSSGGRSLKNSLLSSILSAQIHSSFYFISFIFASLYFFDYIKFSPKKTLIITCISVLILSPLALFFAVFFEARQVALDESLSIVSGYAFLFWGLINLFILYLFIRNNNYINDWKICFVFCSILLYLSLYYSFPYSGRIFESSLPIIIIYFLRFPFQKLKYFLIFLCSLFLYQWSPLLSGDVIFRLSI